MPSDDGTSARSADYEFRLLRAWRRLVGHRQAWPGMTIRSAELHGGAPETELVVRFEVDRFPGVMLGDVMPIWDQPAVVIDPERAADWTQSGLFEDVGSLEEPWGEVGDVRWRKGPPRQPRRA